MDHQDAHQNAKVHTWRKTRATPERAWFSKVLGLWFLEVLGLWFLEVSGFLLCVSRGGLNHATTIIPRNMLTAKTMPNMHPPMLAKGNVCEIFNRRALAGRASRGKLRKLNQKLRTGSNHSSSLLSSSRASRPERIASLAPAATVWKSGKAFSVRLS